MKVFLVLLFVGVLLYSGYTSMRSARTVNDFLLGGRGIGPWLSAFAFGTTYFSAVIFIGYAGNVGWNFGLSGLWIVVGNALVGSLLAWYVLGRRTREVTAKLNAITMPEFLEARYQSRGMKIFAALVIFVFLVPYSASVFMGLSYLFNQTFGIPYIYVCIGMTLLTAVYLVMGGYRALAMTDLFQGVVMLFGVGMLLYYVLSAPEVNGLFNSIKSLSDIDPKLAAPVGPPGWLPLASLVLLTSLGTWGLPQMVQKFYAIKSEAAIKPAMIVATFFAVIITFGAYFTGSLTRLFFNQMPIDPVSGKATSDLLMPQLLDRVLPEFAMAIILLLVLSASMSTLASLVLVSSSAVSVDLLRSLRPQVAEKHGVLAMRFFCLVFLGLSFLLAMAKPAIILSLMAISWGTVAGVFLAPYLFGLFWKKTTQAGAWAGSLTGLTVSVGLSLYFKLDSAMIPVAGSLAMLIPLMVVPLVSLFTRSLPAEHVDVIFGKNPPDHKKQTLLKGKEVESL